MISGYLTFIFYCLVLFALLTHHNWYIFVQVLNFKHSRVSKEVALWTTQLSGASSLSLQRCDVASSSEEKKTSPEKEDQEKLVMKRPAAPKKKSKKTEYDDIFDQMYPDPNDEDDDDEGQGEGGGSEKKDKKRKRATEGSSKKTKKSEKKD